MNIFETKYHRDGTVTLWNVFKQELERGYYFDDEILASLSCEEMQKVLKHTNEGYGYKTTDY